MARNGPLRADIVFAYSHLPEAITKASLEQRTNTLLEAEIQQQQEPPPTPFQQVSSSSTEGVPAGAASSSPDEVDRLAELPKQALPSPPARLIKQASSVGSLCRALPPYVQRPPIEAVVFGWGVSEDGQLVRAHNHTVY